MPRVSVILPTYNWSSVLRYSIRSVLRQTFGDFELLVVGDGCTDDSQAVVAQAGDARVRWINLPENSGHQTAPNNEALRQARGDVIAYIGPDDLWLPHHLAVTVRAIDAGADLAYTLCMNVPENGALGWPVIPRPEEGSFASPVCMVHRASVTTCIGGWRDHRSMPPSTSPDVELWRRAAAAGMQFQFVPRLTGIKFPAAWRRNVYLKRPSHEQASWTAAIEADPDFEIHQLAAFAAGKTPVPAGMRYRDLLHYFFRQTLAQFRLRRSLGGQWLRPRSVVEARRHKGL